MLLEAMIGILIFSLGVLALVAMQAVSVSNVSNARFRSEAAFLANEILSQAWVDRGADYANVANYSRPNGRARRPAANWVRRCTRCCRAATLPPTSRSPRRPRAATSSPSRSSGRRRTPSSASNHVAIGFVSEPSESAGKATVRNHPGMRRSARLHPGRAAGRHAGRPDRHGRHVPGVRGLRGPEAHHHRRRRRAAERRRFGLFRSSATRAWPATA